MKLKSKKIRTFEELLKIEEKFGPVVFGPGWAEIQSKTKRIKKQK